MAGVKLTPFLTVKDARAIVEFYKKAFGAVERSRQWTPSGQFTQPYGVRQGRIADPAGHHWLIGKPLR